MKKLFTVTALTAALIGAAHADTIKIGVALGFTGPAESLAGPMAAGAEMALKEASDSGAFLGGTKITAVRADSTCIDAPARQPRCSRTWPCPKASCCSRLPRHHLR
jgi:branched-chain amino acid transport system substrate-binding protein